MTILIVDDNATMRRLLRRAVSDLEAVVWECNDGRCALAAYQDCKPDVVLMDIRMPGTDGFQATREIVHAFSQARVLIVTDYDEDSLRSEAMQAGALGYVCKQNLLTLGDTVRRLAPHH